MGVLSKWGRKWQVSLLRWLGKHHSPRSRPTAREDVAHALCRTSAPGTEAGPVASGAAFRGMCGPDRKRKGVSRRLVRSFKAWEPHWFCLQLSLPLSSAVPATGPLQRAPHPTAILLPQKMPSGHRLNHNTGDGATCQRFTM